MPPPDYFSSQQSDDIFHQGWSPLISSKGETRDCSLKNLAMNNEQQRGGKVSGIRQIVRLKELLHKWQNVTLSSKTNSPHHGDSSQHGGISPSINRRLKNSAVIMCDSDEEGCHSPEPPPDVPKGFLAVYVGKELPIRRFIIPTTYLSHHLFKVLLEKAEEEFGFDHGGGLTIPCEIETFKFLLNCIETENQAKGENSSSIEINGEHSDQVIRGESSRQRLDQEKCEHYDQIKKEHSNQVKREHLDNVKGKHLSETAGESSLCREE